MRTVMLCALLISGCGGTGSQGGDDMAPSAAFSGTWLGTLVQAMGTCSDGSTTAVQSVMTGYQITQAGTTLSWPLSCGANFFFNVGFSGMSATQQGITTCPPVTKSGNTVVTSFSNGSLTLNGNALSITLDVKDDVSGTATGSCTTTISGTLARQ